MDVSKLPDELAAELAKLPPFETVEHARPAVDGPGGRQRRARRGQT